MSSPVFGSNRNARNLKDAHKQMEPSYDLRTAQLALAMYSVEKSLRRMAASLNRIVMNKKRACFLKLKSR